MAEIAVLYGQSEAALVGCGGRAFEREPSCMAMPADARIVISGASDRVLVHVTRTGRPGRQTVALLILPRAAFLGALAAF